MADSATLANATIGENVYVMAGATLVDATVERSVVPPDATLEGATVRRSIIDADSHLAGVALSGALIELNTRIPARSESDPD
ncbi:hypothetical protein [Halosolutus halophilus]|uniref:hypothetical protein n=1 Tax=Halosolutus halophilus TaxID=1552990 RepID=UPI002234F94A|nr:hypothetical protein [Halosolutus halophilus]